MSRSFARFIQPIFKSFKPNDEPLSSEMNKIINLTLGTIAICATFGHCAYAIGTEEYKLIKVNKKYQFDRNGFTEFMIIDENGNHYNVNNSVWYWKWNSIEDWHKMKSSKEIAIKYYGWRVPLLGLFPNIIMSQTDKVLDSITSTQYIKMEYAYEKQKEESSNTYNLLKHVKPF
jgi:hypothetical protein